MSDTDTTTDTLTLADVFERLGLRPEQVKGVERFKMGALVARYQWCSLDGTATLQTLCGGECLVAIYWQPQGHQYVRTTRPAYIVRDDDNGRRWEHLRRTVYGNDTMAAAHAMGPCPHPVLRMAQSG